MNIWEIKNKNKLVFAIDSQFKDVLIYICKAEIRAFNGVPLTHEDLYYAFLGDVHKYTSTFDHQKDVEFKTYISIKCKYFCRLMCRKYWSKNDAILNNYVEWDDRYCVANDIEINDDKFNIGLLNQEEFEYFKYRFLKGMPVKDVCAKMGINWYRSDQIMKGIMLKVKSNQKN